MYLFLDTETNGVAANPRIVSLGWLVCDEDGRELCVEGHIIKPDGFSIHPSASYKHGITDGVARTRGIPIKQALAQFCNTIRQGPFHFCVGHNLKFDLAVVVGEYERLGAIENLSRIPGFCTMKETRRLCGLRNAKGDLKYPTLQELHRFLFEQDYTPVHDAVADARACSRCFFELDRRGLVTRPLTLVYA